MALLATQAFIVPGRAQRVETVLVQSVGDESVVVVRGNGEVHRLEYGVGCIPLWRAEGKRVIVSSPAMFAGIGSKIVLPDALQECRIWDAELLGTVQAAPGEDAEPKPPP